MEYNYEQIVKYIKSELSPAEMQSFEEELSKNKTLQQEVALYKDVDVTLSNEFKYKKEDTALQATLSQLSKKYATEYAASNFEIKTTGLNTSDELYTEEAIDQTKPSITRRLFPLAALAAAAALLLFLFNPFTQQMSPVQLADQHFAPYTLETFMGNGDSNEILKKGKKYYNGEAYNLAIENFNKYLAINSNDAEVLLAKGSAELKLNKTEAAIQTFQLIQGKASAKWYLSLAYLKNGETKNAIPLLESLSEGKENLSYTKRAKEILANLSKQ